MKKFVSLKTKVLVVMSLAIIVIIVGTVTVGYVLSSLSYSQKIKSPFSMSYNVLETIVYPQTYVGDELNSTLENLMTLSTEEQISNGLKATGKQFTTYANSVEKICLEYKYNNQKYARLVGAVPYGSTKFLNSSGGGTIKDGNNYWFKVEPIEFDTFTLSTGETAQMAKMILGSMAFSTANSDWSADTCTLRTYLNSTFLEESGIYKVAKDRIYYSTEYSDSTTLADNGTQVTSKLWLPSVGEILEIYSTTEIRKKVATDFARATYTKVCDEIEKNYQKDINGITEDCSYYWLRSADSSSSHSWLVFQDASRGAVYIGQSWHGFAPAFVVNE